MSFNGKNNFLGNNKENTTNSNREKCKICNEIGCDGDCQKKVILSVLDKITPQNTGLNTTFLLKTDYSGFIEQKRMKLFILLFGITEKDITGLSLIGIGYQFISIGGIIGIFDESSKNDEEDREEEFFENEFSELSLEDVNLELIEQIKFVSTLLSSLPKSLKNANGLKIKQVGEKIVKLGRKILDLESVKKKLEE